MSTALLSRRLSSGIGVIGDEGHNKLVRSICDWEAWSRDLLQDSFRDMIRWHRLYLAKISDPRGEDELWRANVFVPYPYSGVETAVAAVMDILSSADPLFQTEGVGDEDEIPARSGELLLDHTYRINLWRKRLALQLREAAIQGTAAFKTVWLKQTQRFVYQPSVLDHEEFAAAVNQAIQKGAPAPPDPELESDGFETWRLMVNAAGNRVPEAPKAGPRQIISFQGPKFERVPIFNLRLDPRIDSLTEQPQMIHRVVKPLSWVLSLSDDDPNSPLPFSRSQVEAVAAQGGEEFDEWEEEIHSMLQVHAGASGNPLMQDRMELWEVRRRGLEFPSIVVANRRAIINKHPETMPYMHGESEVHLLRNIPVPGMALGISELQEPETMYGEMNKLRNLRLDAVTLRTLPMMTKLRDMGGIPQTKRQVRPGEIWDIGRPDQFQPLAFGNVDAASFRELFEIKQDIDETNSTPSQVRGGPSTIGRVSATESERRVSQALVRMKLKVAMVEEELMPSIKQALALWYQFGGAEMRFRVGGAGDMATIKRSDVFAALDIDFRFRGASRVLNRDMQVQQLLLFARTFANNLMPSEIRALMKRVVELSGIRGAGEIVSDKGTEAAQQAWEVQKSMAEAQMRQAQLTQGMGGQPGAPGAEGGAPGQVQPPQDVGLEMARALEEGGGVPGEETGVGAGPGGNGQAEEYA